MNYTLDIEAQFMNFTSQMRRKEHMDDVFVMGKAMSHYLNEYNSGDSNENKSGQLMAKFLDAHVKDKVQGLSNEDKDFKFLARSLQIIGMVKGENGRYQRYNFSTRKFLQYLKRTATSSIMFLSPISGFINTMQAYTASVRQGLAYTTAKNLDEKFNMIGAEGIKDINDFGAADYHKGIKSGYDTIMSPLTGKDLNQNKLWLLAKSINFMPDSADYKLSSSSLMVGAYQ
jgi:hypothetical protein